ncbi:hypothetical protein ACVW0I_000749 [Bradyrhizobium sp. LM6.11]
MKRIEPRRHHDPAEDVAAQLVGAEPVRGRGRLQRRGGVGRQRVIRHHIGTEDRGKQDHDQQREGKACDLVLAEHVTGLVEQRDEP